MWIRCMVVIALIVAVPWTIGDSLWRAAVIFWFDVRSHLADEWRDAKRCWRNKTFH